MENQETLSLGSYSHYFERFGFQLPKLKEQVSDNLGIIIVLPVHAELDLLAAVKSLSNCNPCNCSVELILVFNASEKAEREVIEKNQKARKEVENWFAKQELKSLPFKLLILEENSLPAKHAGVGLARKIGMDEALFRFHKAERLNGVIACFDADSSCEQNYLVALEKHFKQKDKTAACSIYFEHPTEGNDFEKQVYEGIWHYELHLRYYVNGLAYAGFPYAIHTIGSSMAVRAINYEREGGMNKRKAGEDFYFLQKFISNGNCSLLNSTCIYPSPRMSDRVPFGTGRAIKEMLEKGRQLDLSYDFKVFQLLKDLNESFKKDNWMDNTFLKSCFGSQFLIEKRLEMKSNASSEEQYKRKIYQWFNAFQCLKFIHFIRDHHYPNQRIDNQVELLLQQIKPSFSPGQSTDLLFELRKIDRSKS